MGRFYKYMLRSVSLMLAISVVSCYQSGSEFDGGTGVMITFDTNIEPTAETKATIIDNANKNSAIGTFGVYGYSMNSEDGGIVAETDPNYQLFNNVAVSYDDVDTTWEYDNPMEWPVGVSNILFFGYIPYLDDTTTEANKYITNFTHTTSQITYDYAVPTTVEDQYDLLISKKSYADIGGTVMLLFEHQLSAVEFYVANNPNWKITNLKLSGFKGAASLVNDIDADTTTWTLSGEAVDFEIPNIDYDKTGVANDGQIAILGDDQTLMMIPQAIPSDATLTVTIVSVDDPDGATTDITIPFITETTEWVDNYIYAYTMYIDSGSITFTDVTVKEWEDEVNIGFDDSGNTQRIGYINLDDYTNDAEGLQEKLEFFNTTMVRKIIVSGVYWDGAFGVDLADADATITNPFMIYCPDVQIIDMEAVTGCAALPDYAFYAGASGSNSLTEVTLPSDIVTVGEGLFYNATLLTTINFVGAYVFEKDAMAGCSSLTTLRFENKTENIVVDGIVLGESGCEVSTIGISDTSTINLELYVGRAAYNMYQASQLADGEKNPDDALPSVPMINEYSWAEVEWNTISYFGDAGVVYDNNIDLDFYNTASFLALGLEARVQLGFVKPVFYGTYYDGAFGESSFTPRSINISLADMDYDYTVPTNHVVCQPNTTSPLYPIFNQLLTIDLSNVTGLEEIFTSEGAVSSIFSVDENSNINKIIFPTLKADYFKVAADDEYDDSKKKFVFPPFAFAFNQNLSNITLEHTFVNDNQTYTLPVWGSAVTEIGDGAFMGYQHFVPSNNSSIQEYLGENGSYSWSSVIQPISKIGNYAFLDNDNIEELRSEYSCVDDNIIVTSSTINSLGKGAFSGCDNLSSVGGFYTFSTLYSSSVDAESGNNKSFDYSGRYFQYGGPLRVDEVGEYAFAYTSNLNEISLDGSDNKSQTLGTLGEGAFAYAKNVQAVMIQGYEKIPDYCFKGITTCAEYDADGSYYQQIDLIAPKIGSYILEDCIAYYREINDEGFASLYAINVYTREVEDYAFANMRGVFNIYIYPYPGETTYSLGKGIFSGITQTNNTDRESTGNSGIESSSYINALGLRGYGQFTVDPDVFEGFDNTENCWLLLDQYGATTSDTGYEYSTVTDKTWRGKTWRGISGNSNLLYND